jgi:hypothetical protein
MSVSGYAFINADGIVVQAIGGELDVVQQAQFLRDYSVLFGATAIIEVEQGTSVWIGGAYTDGQFQSPPQPEPEVIEGASEELLPSEVPDDPLPS